MTNQSNFDQILEQADGLARAGAWTEVLPILRRALELHPGHPGVLTGIGTCLIQLNRASESLEPFRSAIERAPDSPEAHNNLGVALSLAGDLPGAEQAYRDALQRDPAHLPAWKNLAAVCLRQNRLAEGMQILAAVVQAHPGDVESVMLLAGFYEEAEEFPSAETLYRAALTTQPDQADAKAGLERVTARQAQKRIAQPEHAGKLAGLKALRSKANIRRAVFYGTGEVSDPVRMRMPAQALGAEGWRVEVRQAPIPEDADQFDIFVFSRPHLSPSAYPLMEACRKAGKRVIVDVDDDFHHIPEEHPGYRSVGPGNPERLKTLERALEAADAVIVPTPLLAEHYRTWARRVEVLPNCWSRANPLWERPAVPRQSIHIGWAGTFTHREDIAQVKSEIVRTLRAAKDAVLIIGGDRGVFDFFAMLPDSQRAFIEMVPYEDYPVMLSQFDILLAPLRDVPFNRAKSDIKLLEAGIRRIPWLASDLPAYREWGQGGVLAAKPSDWHDALLQLAGDARLRKKLGAEGRAKAEEREIGRWVERWAQVLEG